MSRPEGPGRQALACLVTGTDTGIGKTRATLGLMTALKKTHARVVGMKPVASGCARVDNELRNEDALLIQAHGSVTLPYASINPYAFEEPVAPHVAAMDAGCSIELEKIIACYRGLHRSADALVVEGVGGWRVPFGSGRSLSGVAARLDLPVVLVVGMRLGCINHALLTAEAITGDGLKLAGWIANDIDPAYVRAGATLAFLKEQIAAPMMGHIPFMEQLEVEKIAGCLDLSPLKALPAAARR